MHQQIHLKKTDHCHHSLLKSEFNDGHQNNIIDKMQTRKRLYELVEYEKYNTPDKKITDFSTEGHE